MKKIILLTVSVVVVTLIIVAFSVYNNNDGYTETTKEPTNTLYSSEKNDDTENIIFTDDVISNDNLDKVDPNKGEETLSAIGGVLKCTEHYYSYHTIPGALITLVGSTEYEEWRKLLYNDNTQETTCQNPINIKMFIDAFDISREEYEERCDLLTYCEVDRNVLFNGTDAEIDQYFRNINELENQGKKRNHYLRVQDYIRMTYKDKLSTIETEYIIGCIPEYVIMLDIDRAELEEYIKKAYEDIKNDLGVCDTFDYNLDLLYGTNQMQAGNMNLTGPSASILAVNEDDDPTNDISSNELNEMFCRVGRYAE